MLLEIRGESSPPDEWWGPEFFLGPLPFLLWKRMFQKCIQILLFFAFSLLIFSGNICRLRLKRVTQLLMKYHRNMF